jgi:hypothetical protein
LLQRVHCLSGSLVTRCITIRRLALQVCDFSVSTSSGFDLLSREEFTAACRPYTRIPRSRSRFDQERDLQIHIGT